MKTIYAFQITISANLAITFHITPNDRFILVVNPGAPGCEYVQNIVRMIFVIEVNDVVSAFNRKNTLKR